MKASRIILPALWLVSAVEARFSFGQAYSAMERYNPFNEEEEEVDFLDQVLPATAATSTMLYGASLIAYGKQYPAQIHFITMLRATGYEKMEKALQVTKGNIRDAIFAVVWNAPSFLKAARSLRKMQDRVDQRKRILKVTTKAKADGIVTPNEAARIKRMNKKQIKNIQRDMKRLVKAGASLGKVWQALDFDEIKDVVKGFMFQMMAVLASGHNDSAIGKLIARWCLFLNLSSLLMDTNVKLDFPISKLILTRSLSSEGIDKKKEGAIENMAKAIYLGTSGFLVVARRQAASSLNSAMVSAAVFMRGLRAVIHTFWDKKDDDDTIWKKLGEKLETGAVGGVVMVALTVTGLIFRHREVDEEDKETEEAEYVKYVKTPLSTIESGIDRLSIVIDKIV
eukprot:CAMPEP_0194049336 /NCGR_PEP_ID=MMETSP0009_2-20130614/30388_1 /TAXON_ID=210454 /ORGANISM="Grammatophora oceanica, Strain CCMP 410" /LENGTH=395 /DNA_ID=CAMNT_0038695463 /DNA_START=58 /DNA_END=1245 /DNA_ORIENTATION=-